jgi:uncharacterized protein (DUF433 family)
MTVKLTEPEPAAAEQDELLKRIVYNPNILSGKAIIRGHRMSVSNVLGMLANGATPEELLAEYEWLEADDIRACLSTPRNRRTVTASCQPFMTNRSLNEVPA